MGNNTSQPAASTNTVDEKEIESIIERINRLSFGLYKMYGTNFTDNKFCNRVAITYEKKLGQLPLYKLKAIDKAITQPNDKGPEKVQMEAFLKYEPKGTEKFMVNDLKENLVDFFTDKNIEFGTIDNINTSVPGMKYINPKTLTALKQAGGADPGSAINKLLNELPSPQNTPQRPPNADRPPRRDRDRNRNKKFRRNDRPPRPNQPPRPQPPRQNRPPPPPISKLDETLANIELTNLENIKSNNTENIKLSNMENKTKPKTFLNEKNEVQKLLLKKNNKAAPPLNKRTSKGEAVAPLIKKEFANIAKNEKAMTEAVNRREKNIKAFNLPKTEPLPPTQPLPTPTNINTRLTCGKDDKECYLTQAELCEKISKYYILKGNVIAVILSAIPRKKDNVLTGSFCYSRFKALREGRLCLPPGITELETMSMDNKVRHLSKFINNTDEFKCKGVSGNYRILNEKEKQALVTNDNKFNKFYILYTAKLYNQYLESLRQLIGMLEVLESDYMINNAKLNEIALKVKTIIDAMHTSCQFNYISAILAYLRADLDVTQKDRKQTNAELAELEKGLTTGRL